VLLENCMHCPACSSNSSKGNCEFDNEIIESSTDTDELKKDKAQRVAADEQIAVLNLQLCRLSNMNVTGILGLCKEFEHAIEQNKSINASCFLSGISPLTKHSFHPSYNLRKFYEVIEMISGSCPVARTRSKSQNDTAYKKLSFISRKDESILIYRVFETYFLQLISIIPSQTGLALNNLFRVLENSSMYQCLFREKYEVLVQDPLFCAMTERVCTLAKHDSRVQSAKKKVCYPFNIWLDLAQENTEERGSPSSEY
jgi:hypothetical protein